MALQPVTLISAPPNFVSVEEHRNLASSTPASFNDIPPVIRHREDHVSIHLDPPVEGLSAEELSKGTLYVIDSVLAYIAASSGHGFQVLYPSITIHAVSRSGDSRIVYCQLERRVEAPDADSEEDVETVELKINPSDPTALDTIFEALSLCAAKHPDPAGKYDEDEDDSAFFTGTGAEGFQVFTGGPDEELSEVGRAALEHLESIIVYPNVQAPKEEESEPKDEKVTSAVIGS